MFKFKDNDIALYFFSLVLGFTTGCGGGSSSISTLPTTPTQPTQPTQNAPASGSEFLYSFRDPRILAAPLDPATGKLEQLTDVTPASTSLKFNVPPIQAPSGKLYAPAFDYVNSGESVIRLTITGQKGELSAYNNLTPVSQVVNEFVMDGSGRFLFDCFYSNSVTPIQSLIIDSGSGVVRLGPSYTEPLANGTIAIQVADPKGKFLYALASNLGIQIFVYAIDPATGAISNVPDSPFSALSFDGVTSDTFRYSQLLVSPSGKYLYLYYVGTPEFLGPQLQNIYTYAVDSATGKLTETSSSPFVVPGGDVRPMKFSPSGNLLYVPQRFWDRSTGIITTDIAVFKVNPADGSIAPDAASTVAAGMSFFPDPSGKVLLVGPGGGTKFDSFWSYLVDDSTGALTPAQGSPFTVSDVDARWDLFTVARVP
jgi:6-phosphogluconolactonase (cycloisomerase 2 family)